MENENNFSVNPLLDQSPYVNGLNFMYSPEFLRASLNASYINDRSMRNMETNAYNASIQVPISRFGISANYGINGYDSRQSSQYGSQNYRKVTPTYGINYSNGGLNAYIQKQQGQSPYFGVNYTNKY